MDTRKGLFANNSDLIITVLAFLFGAAIPFLEQWLTGQLTEIRVIAPLVLGVLIATIWIPGAGMSRTETRQSQILTHVPVLLFGILFGSMAAHSMQQEDITGLMAVGLCGAVFSVFLSFWATGYQSRRYIADMFFQTGCPARFPHTTRLTGVLCGPRVRLHTWAHQIRGAVLDASIEETLDPDFWRKLETELTLGTRGNHRARLENLLSEAKTELQAAVREGCELRALGSSNAQEA